MPWKLTDDGVLAKADGNPVLVTDEAEVPVGAEDALAALDAPERILELESRLEAFEGIDPEAARAALAVAAEFEAGRLVPADQADGEPAEPDEDTLQQMADLEAKVLFLQHKLDETTARLERELVGHAFASSPYIRNRLTVPAEMVQAMFGAHFRVEDGLLKGYLDGKPLMSKANPEVPAGFDEALEKMIQAWPHKNAILRGAGGSGSGAPARADSGPVGVDLMRLPPTERITRARQ
jgi:hypothetical protein